MSKRITAETADRVRDLLKEGVTHRQISKLTGVSRDTIRNISLDIWREQTPYTREKRTDRTLNCGRIGRCHKCGALVQLPCIACNVRSLKTA